MYEQDFGLRLAMLRVCIKNCSARTMSLSMGQNAGYINNIENGRSKPSYEGLINICNYLDISLAELFDEGISDPLLFRRIIKCLHYMNKTELEHMAGFLEEAFPSGNGGKAKRY